VKPSCIVAVSHLHPGDLRPAEKVCFERPLESEQEKTNNPRGGGGFFEKRRWEGRMLLGWKGLVVDAWWVRQALLDPRRQAAFIAGERPTGPGPGAPSSSLGAMEGTKGRDRPPQNLKTWFSKRASPVRHAPKTVGEQHQEQRRPDHVSRGNAGRGNHLRKRQGAELVGRAAAGRLKRYRRQADVVPERHGIQIKET